MQSSVAPFFLTFVIRSQRHGWTLEPKRCLVLNVPIITHYRCNAHFQVHVSLVGLDKMRVSWITGGSAPPTIEYGSTQGSYPETVTGSTTSYKYVMYHSGEIHDAVIGPLQPNTTYYYRFSSDRSREFSFKTLPSQLPIKFVVIGNNKTLVYA